MTDPHVVSIRYRLETGEGITFENPPPVESERESFRLTLADGVATFEMKQHYPDAQAARQVIEPFLRAWEIDAALRMGSPEIRFAYQDAEVIDRDPPPAGSHLIVGTVHVTLRSISLTASQKFHAATRTIRLI